jgi:hypothetical protein
MCALQCVAILMLHIYQSAVGMGNGELGLAAMKESDINKYRYGGHRQMPNRKIIKITKMTTFPKMIKISKIIRKI